MICLSSADLPDSLLVYRCYLQVFNGRQWYTCCRLVFSEARELLMWLDRHPEVSLVRLLVESIQ